MTKVAILMPSHIYYKLQIDLLDKSIISLLEQTAPLDIYISISFENEEYKKSFTNNILRKYGKKINFIFSDKQLYQMEHLRKLSSKIADKQYDMIMFCDDDDTYNVNRVEKFIESFEYGQKISKMKYKSFSGVKEIVNSDNPELEIPEYWCYGVIPDVLLDFFSHFNDNNIHLINHKFGDMYFRHYLRKNKIHLNWLIIDIFDKKDKLYYYNINNSNSITGSINKNNCIYDLILLHILDCRNDDDFYELMKQFNINKKHDMFKVFDYIYKFCILLYK